MTGSDCVLQLLFDLAVVVALTDLARGRAGCTEHCGAAEDSRREQHTQCDAADQSPPEPAFRAVVCRLLDLQRAVGVPLDHEHALDLHGPAVFQRLQCLVGLPCVISVGEVGDKERVTIITHCGSDHFRLVNAVLVF